MLLELPELGLSEPELKQELAIALFQRNKVSLAMAASIASMTRLDFQRLLASSQIPVHYTMGDFEDDLRVLGEQGSG